MWLIGVALLSVHVTASADGDFFYGKFSDDFAWSTATSAYQVEGGWDEDGKGPSIWDTFCHNVTLCKGVNGDIACDSYHRFERDIEMLKELNVSHYRFSLSWPRLLPEGITTKPNPAGISYYNRLINRLIENNITPQVTMYHWDLPQAFQRSEQDGWLNEASIGWFSDYARFCFSTFGERIKFWITFNEPHVITWLGYGAGVFAPGISSNPGTYPYIATHNLLRAHANAVNVYRKEFSHQKGQIGIVISGAFSEPGSSLWEDKAAAERVMQFEIGWFTYPVMTGDYPEMMKEVVGYKSFQAKLPKSRLPEFTDAEKALLKGSVDFIGVNYYGAQLVSNQPHGSVSNYELDKDARVYHNDSWRPSGSDWLFFTPWSMRSILRWYQSNFGNKNLTLYITENGVSDNNGSLSDSWRIDYYRDYTNELLKAIRLDGINVKGYTAWSLMDNLEWTNGYSQRFGMYNVDYDSPNRTRTMKDSAKFFKKLVHDNGFIDPRPSSTEGTSSMLPPTPTTSAQKDEVVCVKTELNLPVFVYVITGLISLTLLLCIFLLMNCIASCIRRRNYATL